MQQVTFLWSGCPGTYGRCQLTGQVLETRTTKLGAVEYSVKVPELNLPKWIPAEQVIELLTDGYADDQALGYFHNGEWTPLPMELPIEDDDTQEIIPIQITIVNRTPREELINEAANRIVRNQASSAYVAITDLIGEWRASWSHLAVLHYYDGRGPIALDRLITEVEKEVGNRKAAYTAEAMQTA